MNEAQARQVYDQLAAQLCTACIIVRMDPSRRGENRWTVTLRHPFNGKTRELVTGDYCEDAIQVVFGGLPMRGGDHE